MTRSRWAAAAGPQIAHRFAGGRHRRARAVFDFVQGVIDVGIILQGGPFIQHTLHAHRDDADKIVDPMQ